jgi:Holliday junction resolvasome RuvABC DNA-binding subunit
VIATLNGKLRRRLDDRIILEVMGVGYEVFLPPIALNALEGAHAESGDKASRARC